MDIKRELIRGYLEGKVGTRPPVRAGGLLTGKIERTTIHEQERCANQGYPPRAI